MFEQAAQEAYSTLPHGGEGEAFDFDTGEGCLDASLAVAQCASAVKALIEELGLSPDKADILAGAVAHLGRWEKELDYRSEIW